MEFDLLKGEREFLEWAIANPCLSKRNISEELKTRMIHLRNLLRECGEAGCTLHLN
jgi:hypothetical protein